VAMTSGGFSTGASKSWQVSNHQGLGASQVFRTGILMAGLVALLAVMGRMLGGIDGMVLFGIIDVLCILRIFNRRELRGVLAHELSHVRNRDTLISTIAASVAGLISAIGTAVRWGAMFGGGRRSDERECGGLELLVMAIVAPIVAMLVQLAISRSREFGADETGARLSGNPDALADALLRLEQGVEALPYEHAGLATAHLFIVNPFAGRALMKLMSTHPATEERVARLRRMALAM
jgi:heat shock protein HtpX